MKYTPQDFFYLSGCAMWPLDRIKEICPAEGATIEEMLQCSEVPMNIKNWIINKFLSNDPDKHFMGNTEALKMLFRNADKLTVATKRYFLVEAAASNHFGKIISNPDLPNVWKNELLYLRMTRLTFIGFLKDISIRPRHRLAFVIFYLDPAIKVRFLLDLLIMSRGMFEGEEKRRREKFSPNSLTRSHFVDWKRVDYLNDRARSGYPIEDIAAVNDFLRLEWKEAYFQLGLEKEDVFLGEAINHLIALLEKAKEKPVAV